MDTANIVIWTLFIIAIIFLGYFYGKRIKANKEIRAKALREYEEKKQRYAYLKPGIFDECPHEDVATAALFHCMRKEDEDFEHYFENMNESERTIYTIYQVSSSLEGQHPSLHSFFLTPANKEMVPIVSEVFEEVGAHEIADLMKAARRFAQIIENDEEDQEDDPEMGDYGRYNFSDFTNEFITLVTSTNLGEKLIDYVLKHKEDFYDENIPTNNEGDDDSEGTSE